MEKRTENDMEAGDIEGPRRLTTNIVVFDSLYKYSTGSLN